MSAQRTAVDGGTYKGKATSSENWSAAVMLALHM